MAMIAKNRTKSTWTPLSNEDTNNKIFEERLALLGKWFEKWNDDQRKKVFEELVGKSKLKQLHYARDLLQEKAPSVHEDFTRVLPRVLSIYIFSFLDPRTLCRCARVCWYWKSLTENDKLWMPKCLRLGWILSFTPSPYESGVWKRNYVENLRTLKVHRPSSSTLEKLEKLKLDLEKDYRVKTPQNKKKKPVPWKGSDPVPKDTWRYNVLENDDVVDQVNKERKKLAMQAMNYSQNVRSKVKTGHNILNTTRRSQSATNLRASEVYSSMSMNQTGRPDWAQSKTSPTHNSINKNHSNRVTSPSRSRPVTERSDRDPPTARLFPEQPWKVPNTDSDDDQ